MYIFLSIIGVSFSRYLYLFNRGVMVEVFGENKMYQLVFLFFFCIWAGLIVYSRSGSAGTLPIVICFSASVAAFFLFVLYAEDILFV